MSESELIKLDRYDKFEKVFPFYRMDVNGYILRVKEAMQLEHPTKLLYEQDHVELPNLQLSFKVHESWNDLEDENSALVKFLNDTCVYDKGPKVNKFCSWKLRVLGILWCEGSNKEKVFELYSNMQDNEQTTIAWSDKDFKPNFFAILDLASSIVFKCEQKYTDEEFVGPCPYSDEEI